MEERDYTADAAKMGWVEQEEWKGKAEAWRPAKEFVERGENIVPILKDRITKAETERDKDRKRMADLETDVQNMIKLNKDAEKRGFESAKKEYDSKIKELDVEEFDAFQEGDAEKFKKVKEEKEALEKPEEPKEPEKPESNPVFEEWSKKNTWYQDDTELTEFADFVGARIKQATPEMGAEDFYKAVEDKVKTTFTAKFTNPNRDEPGKTESGSPAPAKSGKQTFSDLPDEAKSAYNRLNKQFEAKGRKLDKKDYVKTYFEEE